MGVTLVRLLESRISSLESASRSRADIVESMGSAAGIEASTVNQILDNDIDCPPMNRLSGFARVLDVPVARMRRAIQADGCGDTEEDE